MVDNFTLTVRLLNQIWMWVRRTCSWSKTQCSWNSRQQAQSSVLLNQIEEDDTKSHQRSISHCRSENCKWSIWASLPIPKIVSKRSLKTRQCWQETKLQVGCQEYITREECASLNPQNGPNIVSSSILEFFIHLGALDFKNVSVSSV